MELQDTEVEWLPLVTPLGTSRQLDEIGAQYITGAGIWISRYTHTRLALENSTRAWTFPPASYGIWGSFVPAACAGAPLTSTNTNEASATAAAFILLLMLRTFLWSDITRVGIIGRPLASFRLRGAITSAGPQTRWSAGQSVLVCQDNRLGRAADTELLIDVAEVVLHRTWLDSEQVADL